MDDEPKTTLFGFPVVESKEVPKGVVLLGRWPTPEDIRKHGSFEAAVKAQAREWSMITGVAYE